MLMVHTTEDTGVEDLVDWKFILQSVFFLLTMFFSEYLIQFVLFLLVKFK